MSIEKNFHRFLYKLVTENLTQNKVAKTIAVHYKRLNRTNKDKFFESLLPLYNTFTDSTLNNVRFEQISRFELPTTPKDYRLKAVRLANVRGIPKDKVKFGFDLFENDTIQNLVLLGPNGTGKSSLFSSIEYIYSTRVGEKDLRTANPESNKQADFIDYLSHFKNTPECEIETVSGKFSIRNTVFNSDEELKIIYPDTHFISDYDIYRKGQLNYLGENTDENSFHHLIASSLGLQDYLDFSNLLKSLSGYKRLKESNRRKELSSEKENLEIEIKNRKVEIDNKTKSVNELKNHTQNTTDDGRERILALISTLKQTSFQMSFNKTEYLKTIEDYKSAHEKFIGLSVNPDLQTEAQFLSLGLDLINHSENCPFCKSSTYSISEIKNKVEKRLIAIKEFDMISKSLEMSIQKFVSELREILNSIQFVGKNLAIEKDRISGINDFTILANNETDLLPFLTDVLKQIVVIDESLSKISSERSPLITRDQQITELIKAKEDLLLIELPNIPGAIEKIIAERQRIITSIEKKLFENQNQSSPKQQIIIFESEIQNLQIAIQSTQTQIENVTKEIALVNHSIETFSRVKEEAGAFAKILDVKVNELVASTFGTIKETITEILIDYLKKDAGDDITLNIELKEFRNPDEPDLVNKTIVAEIHKIDKETGEIVTISPSKYFNTFRYRLFSMMVSLSIVIAARRNSGINLPLVLDDVFYASDYNSKATFREFILKILNIFRKFNGEMPFQFILFSHDELVFDCALDAISDFESQKENIDTSQLDKDWAKPIGDKTTFARLFSANEVEDAPRGSPFGEFWDLTYEIPRPIQIQLLNEN